MSIWQKIKWAFGWRPDPYKEAEQEKADPVPLPKPVHGPIPMPAPKHPAADGWAYFDKAGRGLITKDGLDLVTHFEGKYLKAYRDSVGVVTIGWGRIKYDDGTPVRMGDTCTEAQAVQWLLTDLWDDGAQYVRSMMDFEDRLTPYQFSALVSMVFNRGAGRFNEALDDLLDEALKDGLFSPEEIKKVTDKLLTYDYAVQNGKRRQLPGLVRRRYAEREMFLGKNWRLFVGPNWRNKIY
jgi:lysozyme